MLIEYLKEALERVKYEIIEDHEPYYGEITETPGVWSIGKLWKNAGAIWHQH